jgi:hypothetical protein
MEKQIVEIDMADVGHGNPAWIAALEAGKVLYFPNFGSYGKAGFAPQKEELALFREDIRDPKIRNISLSAGGDLKGVVGDAARPASGRRWCRTACSPGAPTTAACTSTPSRRARTGANACCASSPTSTATARRACGAWANRSRTWRGASCRA